MPPPDGAGPAKHGRFSVLWAKQDGRWRLASLRETSIEHAAEPERLGDLAWMLGEWTATSGETTLDVSARWNATETFLLRDMSVTRGGEVVFRVAQRIGWDPLSHKLKSWVFDSDGGYGEGTWTREEDTWIVQTSAVLPDGRESVATHLLTPEGSDHFSWKSTGGEVDGQPAPDAQLQFSRKPITQ